MDLMVATVILSLFVVHVIILKHVSIDLGLKLKKIRTPRGVRRKRFTFHSYYYLCLKSHRIDREYCE